MRGTLILLRLPVVFVCIMLFASTQHRLGKTLTRATIGSRLLGRFANEEKDMRAKALAAQLAIDMAEAQCAEAAMRAERCALSALSRLFACCFAPSLSRLASLRCD